ncbi:hypothetical protein C0989_008606 [Termitomyces sp. Mn162]|nr:hypothetical protein C0989_008606 [Termitomyces sp. Mn162]
MSATSPSTSPKLSSLPPSTSPPRTPVENKHRTSLGSPPSDDSSIIDDLSFEYVFDNEGNYVRLSKGLSTKSNHSSPPTPQDNLPLQPTDSYTKPSPPAITRRASLSRSESAYPVLVTITAPKSDAQPPRSFQRATSGPALMNNKVRPLPRRVAMEESNKQRPLTRTPRTADILQHEKENLNVSDSEQGHEPHPSRAVPPRVTYSRSVHLDGHQRQIMSGPHRAGRVMVSSSMSASAVRLPEYNISESHSIPVATPELENEAEDESVHSQAPSTTPFPSSGPLSEVGNVGDTEIIESSPLSIPASTRQRSYGLISTSSARDSGLPPDVVLALSTTSTQPRRSPMHDSGYGQHQRQQQQLRDEYQNSRSGVAANDNNDNAGGPRRVTLEERERDIRKYRFEEIERRQVEQDHYYESHYEQGQQKIQQQSLPTIHRQHSHKRRDSDTLRSMPMSVALGSPTVVEPPHTGEVSPRMSPPGAKVGRLTPPGKISPSGLKGRISPALIKTGRVSPPQPRATGRVSPASSTALSTHRRSPTASETFMKDGLHERAAKRWSVTEREDEHAHRHEREREREKEGRRIQQQQQESQQQIRAAPAPPVPAAAATSSSQTSRSLVVNKKTYARLDMIGKGGSSRVYRVFDSANTIYAIKRVALDKTDSETMSGYMNEIALLKRLAGNSRIIRLIDSEVRPGPGGSKGYLMLVMECGEVDLAKLISEAVHEPLDMVRVAGYWKQMLQAVHVIHEEKIVHSDLKPANFVIVKGQLKLIDFGIANAIANDTTNIQRDHQIGTVNFMSPEAIELPDGMRRLKVGRPSDIWSLGCILYQMIYGMPPFQHLNVYQKMKAIPDAAHVIDFPEYSVPLAPNPRTSSGASSGTSTPPKRLDHLKTKVRSVVIDTMKSCLLRNPKERATIPELLNQNWLAMTDSELAADETIVKLAPGENILKVQSSSNIAKSASGETFVKVGADETVINPYYMRQLLEYGIKLGQAQNTDMSPERLLREAERLVLELKSLQPS